MYRKTHKAILKHKTEMFCRCHMRTQIRISESLTVVDQRLKYITIEEHYRVGARATRLRSNFECVIHASACYPHPKSDLSRSIAFFLQHQDLKSLIFFEIQSPMLYVFYLFLELTISELLFQWLTVDIYNTQQADNFL